MIRRQVNAADEQRLSFRAHRRAPPPWRKTSERRPPQPPVLPSANGAAQTTTSRAASNRESGCLPEWGSAILPCFSPLTRLAALSAVRRRERSLRGPCLSAKGRAFASWLRADTDRRADAQRGVAPRPSGRLHPRLERSLVGRDNAARIGQPQSRGRSAAAWPLSSRMSRMGGDAPGRESPVGVSDATSGAIALPSGGRGARHRNGATMRRSGSGGTGAEAHDRLVSGCLMRRRRGPDWRLYEALALSRRWLGALRRRSSSATRSAIRSSSVISCHTVERRAPDRRTCPAASSSCSSFSVRA
jgi:hypothetical protein